MNGSGDGESELAAVQSGGRERGTQTGRQAAC